MPLGDWADLLTPATAAVITQDADPASPTYGEEVTGASFSCGYQKLSSAEVRDRGREYGSDIYMIVCDLDSEGDAPITKFDRLQIEGIGEVNVIAITEYRQPDYRIAQVEAELSS